jgi:lipoprotein-anchoring transpeptidase ErfK/SrfK
VQQLEARSERRRRRWLLAGLAVVVVVGVVAAAYAIGRSTTGGSGRAGAASGGAGAAAHAAKDQRPSRAPLVVVSSTPANGATAVAANGTVSITFNDRVTLGAAQPELSPAVAGAWQQPNKHTIQFVPGATMVPFTKETVTIPGGPSGLRADDGATLAAATTMTFTVADGSTMRLQQLLAQLAYLPLTFTPSGPAAAPVDAAQPQAGSFAWRWTTLPGELTSLWTPGNEDAITKGAIMTFEHQSGLAVDGLAGPAVWSAVLSASSTAKVDSAPYTYVLVSKVLPENLTLWNNGVARFTGVPVNTGAPGADTTDGTYAVFEHVTASRMVGTNPDGSKYDDPNVPWASYFNGGDALHGFVRATYGSPQSNGCVEMSIANAGMLWPLTPIGTLVTVVGPAS